VERTAHETFAASRRFAYVPRQSYLEMLDRHADDGGPPLVIHAPSGSGKSALIAYWSERFRSTHNDAFVVEHYIGSGSSVDHLATIRRILLEIRERYDLLEELPMHPEELTKALAAWLWYVRDDDPLVLLIDALNQAPDAAKSVDWLPERFPPSVRCVVTTTEESTVRQLLQRGWRSMTLDPFTLKERQQMVEQFMAERSTTITSEQAEGVATAAGSANPLLLRTRLEEVGHASHEGETREVISYYLGARDLDQLHERMLARLEDQHDRTLVSSVLPALHLSRSGLTRDELSRISRFDRDTIDRFVDRLSFHLIERDGLLNYVHEYLRHAVDRRYLSSGDRGIPLRLRLVQEFSVAQPTIRHVLETCHQLSLIGDDLRLRDYLARIDVTMMLFRGDARYEFLVYWRRLHNRFDIDQAYVETLDRYRSEAPTRTDLYEALNTVGEMLEVVGRIESARAHQTDALRIAEELNDASRIARAAGSLGMLCYMQGRLVQAMEYYQLQYAINEGLADEAALAPVLSRMAAIHFQRGEFESARTLTQRRLDIDQRLGNRRGIAMCYGGLGSVSFNQREYDVALGYFERQLEIARDIGDRRVVALTLGNLGVVCDALDQRERGEECYREQLAVASEIGDRGGVSSAMGHLGRTLAERGEHQAGLDAYRQQLEMARDSGETKTVHSALRAIVDILRELNSDELRPTLVEWMDFATRDGDRGSAARAAATLSAVEMEAGNLAEAERLMAVALTETEADPEGGSLPYTLVQQANLLEKTGRHTEARIVVDRLLAIRIPGESPTAYEVRRASVEHILEGG